MYLKTFLHNFSIKLSSPLFLWNVWNIILPSSLKSSMQRSSDLHRLGIMYVLCMWILKFRPFYIFVIATPTQTAGATMTTYNLHLNKAFDPIKANPGNWSWNITNPHSRSDGWCCCRPTSSSPRTTPTTRPPSGSCPRCGTPTSTRTGTSASPSSTRPWTTLSLASCRASAGTPHRTSAPSSSAWSAFSMNPTLSGDNCLRN